MNVAMIGIDLGTTNSLAAYWTENGPQMIPNVLGEHLTPSVVSVDENNEILVGQIAKERLLTHPEVTASTFKRYMGTEKTYQLGPYTFKPEELSSFVIRSLKADAEAFLGEEVNEAVISVPAYFNDIQRKATKHAAELAGLKVERLISEPTAAAIAYGLHTQESDTTFLVFDLGGGTFDVSILEFFDGVMEVKSIAGDNYLGGEDFTNLLVSHFAATHEIDLEHISSKNRSALYKQAELCKRALTDGMTGEMTFASQGGESPTYTFKLSRGDFERIAGPLLLRLRHPIERALRDAELTPNDLDATILIGGATRMPLIRSIVAKIFGKMPYTQINPDEAVALGAAIQVALKQRNDDLKEVILTDVCPYTLGIETAKALDGGRHESGHFSPIIERNTPIPVSRVERYTTIYDQQNKIVVDIYQGESRKVEHNIKLGELQIDIPPAPAGEQTIDIRFTYDINGILEVEVTTVSTGVKKKVIIEKNPGTLTPLEIAEQLSRLAKIKIHPRDRTENRLLLARGERLYEETLGEQRSMITLILEEFERMLDSQSEIQVKKAAAKLKEQLDQMERWREF